MLSYHECNVNRDKIHSAGICGTDIHITQNLFPKEIPNVLGHEFSGVIHSVGPKLSKDFIGKYL